MKEETKIALFEHLLELEQLSRAKTYDNRDYFEQSAGAFSMLKILGLEDEYITWSENR